MSKKNKGREKWYKSPDDETIGGVKCIKLKTVHPTNPELTTIEWELHGKHGFIWEKNASTCIAIITSSRVARKYLPEEAHPINADDETRITFPIQDLHLWIKRLKITKNREGMIQMSNWFAREEKEES